MSGDRVGPPPSWPEVQQQAAQVEKVNPATIQKAADQFHDAAANAGDHSAALKQSTDALQGGVWAGQAAEAFFGYVKQITTAGDQVQKHLQEVSSDLGVLQGQLADIKGKVQTAYSAAEKVIKETNEKATSAADAADQAAQNAKDGSPPPRPSSADIIEAAKAADEKVAAQAKTDIGTLLAQADELIRKSQQLMKTQIEGGYSTVPLPGSNGTAPQSTGGVHSNGAMSSGSHGGGGGGGGGLGPSGGPPSSTPPGNVQQWISEAIKILQANGIPVTDADIGKIWTIIEKESGGNPNAINNWDSNAAAGHPSKGLMQCIDSTFNAHKLPGHDNIYNPVDNIIAGVRYTFDRYGGFAGHPGLKAMAHGGGYQGY